MERGGDWLKGRRRKGQRGKEQGTVGDGDGPSPLAPCALRLAPLNPPHRLRVYCAGPMRAGGPFVGRFHEMVRLVEELGHDALSELSTTVEWGSGLEGLTAGADGRTAVSKAGPGFGDDYIYRRDMHWLGKADALLAEVSAPSLGVGYEVSCALFERRIPVLCLVHADVRSLSAMISGNTERLLTLVRYRSRNGMREVIRRFLQTVAGP